VNSKVRKQADELMKDVSSELNFKRLRTRIAEAKIPLIPFPGATHTKARLDYQPQPMHVHTNHIHTHTNFRPSPPHTCIHTKTHRKLELATQVQKERGCACAG
jgi:hypothetical protein